MAMEREKALAVLGFNSSGNPSRQGIKKAYRKLALRHHPDKHSNESEDEKKQEEEKFKELGAAYAVLANQSAEEAITLSDENLDQIDSKEDLLNFLHIAIFTQKMGFLKKLLSKFTSGEGEEFGDYLNATNVNGMAALHIATFVMLNSAEESEADQNKSYEALKLILENGADPTIEEREMHVMCTAYLAMLACKMNQSKKYEIVKLFLERGANPHIEDQQGYTALYFMHFCGDHESVKLVAKAKGIKNLSRGIGDSNTLLNIDNIDKGMPKIKNQQLIHAGITICALAAVGFIIGGFLISNWYFVPAAICVFAACFLIKNPIQITFLKTEEPSPEFVEVESERVMGLEGDVPRGSSNIIGVV